MGRALVYWRRSVGGDVSPELYKISKCGLLLSIIKAVSLRGYLEAIFDERRYTERTLPNRLAFREFGALLGVKCYGMNDQCLQARMKSIMTLWEKRMEEMTPEDLRPITMVMYSAALLPTGK